MKKIMLMSFSFILPSLVLMADAPPGPADASKQHERHQKYVQDKATTQGDRQLNSTIRSKVLEGNSWKKYRDVIIVSNNGWVTLEGAVDSPSEVSNLIAEVRKIKNVKNVESNLKVRNP